MIGPRAKTTARRAPALPVGCRACPLRRKQIFRQLSSGEVDFISRMKRCHLQLPAGEELLTQGRTSGSLYTLYEGWAVRLRQLPDGGRQILDFVLPGDLVGLVQAHGEIGYSVLTLTAASFCELDAKTVGAMFRTQPSLAMGVFEGRIQEQERIDARLVMLGRMPAAERIGHLLLGLRERLHERGLTDGTSFALPLHGLQLADAVGLSRVHVMRALRYLRQHELIMIRGRWATIPSVPKLAHFSGFAVGNSRAKSYIL